MLECKNEIIIDWFQCTIFPTSKYTSVGSIFSEFPSSDRVIILLFSDLFNINYNDLVREPFGFNGYDIRYSYKDIDIMACSYRDDMGINIKMTGSGCRDFEDMNIGWNILFSKLSAFDINFNRIDIAIDIFDKNYFDLDLLKKYIKSGLCCSKFKNSLELTKRCLIDGSIIGDTLQFGSKASDIQITFYDKYQERQSAGFIIDKNINFWIRTELRFRHDRAKTIFELINNNSNYSDFIFGILYNYIDFKTFNSTDSNISRRSTAKFWIKFINDNKKIMLSTRSKDRSISKIRNWLLDSTSKSQLMCYVADLPNLKLDTISIDLIYKEITTGIDNIKDKDIQLINDYRLSKRLPIITKSELESYIQDLKYTILE